MNDPTEGIRQAEYLLTDSLCGSGYKYKDDEWNKWPRKWWMHCWNYLGMWRMHKGRITKRTYSRKISKHTEDKKSKMTQ